MAMERSSSESTVWSEPGAAPAPSQPSDETTVLNAARILTGRGEVLENRDLVVRDGRIAEIVPGGTAEGDRIYDLSASTALPTTLRSACGVGSLHMEAV